MDLWQTQSYPLVYNGISIKIFKQVIRIKGTSNARSTQIMRVNPVLYLWIRLEVLASHPISLPSYSACSPSLWVPHPPCCLPLEDRPVGEIWQYKVLVWASVVTLTGRDTLFWSLHLSTERSQRLSATFWFLITWPLQDRVLISVSPQAELCPVTYITAMLPDTAWN